jgi:predicted anti-sigma-YlaC factor YlaD
MECDEAREAISARIDGEDGGLPDDAVEAHLAGCADCRAWRQRAYAVTRRARLGGVFLDRDLTPAVMAAIPPAPGSRPVTRASRAALIVLAAVQLAVTVPLLILGHDHEAGAHAAHELGSFDLALAIAFCVGAIRPVLSAGLAWPCGIAAVGLAGTAMADLIGGQAIGADEAQHLIALAGAALLFWQARAASNGTAAPAGAIRPPQDGHHAVPAPPAIPLWRGIAPQSPGGAAGAARITGPDVAARSGGITPVPDATPAEGTVRTRAAAPDEVGQGKVPGHDDRKDAVA